MVLMIQGGICGRMLLLYICNRNCGFLNNRLHPKAKWFNGFFFLFILLFVFAVEDAVVSWVGWAGFQFLCYTAEPIFTSEL